MTLFLKYETIDLVYSQDKEGGVEAEGLRPFLLNGGIDELNWVSLHP